jgi:hypothetical protein
MTDRAQPGAIDSVIRNDEIAEAMSAFSEGAIVSPQNPTNASIRRSDIDETVLDAFSISTSSNSLDVTISEGEGYVEGWFCRDTKTTLTLPTNATTDIVVGYNTDAIFDPNVDPDRDAADEVIVDLQQNVDPDVPQTVAHRVETDGSGVIESERVAPVGSLNLRGLQTPEISAENQLTIKSDASLDSNIITDAGHDEVDLPQVRNLTVADFEAGTLPQDAVGATANASVQSNVTLEGDFSLRISRNSSGSDFIGLEQNRESIIQIGDEFSYFTQLTDSSDLSFFSLLVSDPSSNLGSNTGVRIGISASNNELVLREFVAGSTIVNSTFNADFSSRTGERLRVETDVSSDRDISVSVFDSSGAEIVSGTVTISSGVPDSGAVQYAVSNPNSAPTVFFDGPFIKRRTPEYFSETKKGITELGNEVTMSGAINIGPQEVPPDHPNYPVVNLPVTDQAASGDDVGYQLEIDEKKALTIEATADGNGGIQDDIFVGVEGSGAGFFINSNGEIVARDENGNDTILT